MLYVCVHGHFYQPPRENPWTGEIEDQPSAYPFLNWNLRIQSECYRPNTAARIQDGQGRIADIVNNYARMSFNFGPTLLSWMADADPATYEAIIEADKDSIRRFGHGSAMAQIYNHVIMPLAHARDKHTQVVWGIRDFEHRFDRTPEGMWLSETAVDVPTLEVLAEHGIEFTVLAPRQARLVRPMGTVEWKPCGGSIDPGQVYRCNLPSGRSIDLFFYDGPMSQAVAFEKLLSDGHKLADRLCSPDANGTPRLSHIATDGESYGHHHTHGDMALAVALDQIESGDRATLTNYAAYRRIAPPTHEVEIVAPSSWSCEHGVGRWSKDCGCRMSHESGWNQAWRRPLRSSLGWLSRELARIYEQHATPLFKDPWVTRDHYVDRLNGRGESFFADHALEPLGEGDEVRATELLEMQRDSMLMHTSCGWFFDDLAGIETEQILSYAIRAIESSERLGVTHLRAEFLSRLDVARSNRAEAGTGRQVYRDRVLPAQARGWLARLERLLERLRGEPGEVCELERAARLAGKLAASGVTLSLWRAQNAAWRLRETALSALREAATDGDESAARAVAALISLCQSVNVIVPE